MVDEVDRAQMEEPELCKRELERIHQQVKSMPVGEPGECRLCGEDMSRLVNGVCAPCRDKYRLP